MAVAVACGLAAACSTSSEPGVEIQALQADVVFGVELAAAEDPIAPPTQQLSESVPADERFDDGSVIAPFRNTFAERFRDLPLRTPPAQVAECPTAPIGASPSEAAPEQVTTAPREGLYAWKRSIAVTQDLDGFPVVSNIEGFENRLLRAVDVVGGGTDPTEDGGQQHTYETVRPDGFGQVLVESFRVNTSPIDAGANSNVDTEGTSRSAEETAAGNGVPVDVPDDAQEDLPNPNRVRVGEPNRGLVLTAQRTFDGNGLQVGAFDPSPPALLLPLPVETGDTWTSTSVDPSSGQTMRVTGTVNDRRSVDACGTLLDGWVAELDVVIASSAGTVTRETELIVSTSAGAMLIGEQTTESGVDEAGRSVTAELRYGIAQVDPDPLPAAEAAS